MTELPEEFFDVFYDLAQLPHAKVHRDFGGWVPEVYDLMEGDYEDDIPLVIELADQTGGPVVDLGSGTGRLTIPLAQLGVQVYAVERDEAMRFELMDQISSLPIETAPLITQIGDDIRDFRLPEPAALAVCSTNTFLYLGSLTEQRKALANIRANLKPGGRLWLDVYVPKPSPNSEEPFLTSRVNPSDGSVVLYGVQSRDHYFEGQSHVNAFTMLIDPIGRPQIHVQSWIYSWLTPRELTMLLESQGFELLELMGDYEHEPADEGSTQMIAIARRRD